MSMNWKQAIFVGGAILILAACDRVTAPEPAKSLRTVSAAEAARAAKKSEASSYTGPRSTDCRTGYSISVGFADTTSVAGCVW